MLPQFLKYKFITGLLSVVTIVALLVDYFYTNEFYIEGVFKEKNISAKWPL